MLSTDTNTTFLLCWSALMYRKVLPILKAPNFIIKTARPSFSFSDPEKAKKQASDSCLGLSNSIENRSKSSLFFRVLSPIEEEPSSYALSISISTALKGKANSRAMLCRNPPERDASRS